MKSKIQSVVVSPILTYVRDIRREKLFVGLLVCIFYTDIFLFQKKIHDRWANKMCCFVMYWEAKYILLNLKLNGYTYLCIYKRNMVPQKLFKERIMIRLSFYELLPNTYQICRNCEREYLPVICRQLKLVSILTSHEAAHQLVLPLPPKTTELFSWYLLRNLETYII